MGAAVERRVWTQFGRLKLYPNLFVFLVGPPGTGKTVALNPMAPIIRKSAAFTLAPNDLSKQGLLDALGESSKAVVFSDGKPWDYHFLAIQAAELSNFMSKYDLELAGLFTELFDCPPDNNEKKRSHDKGKLIINPGLSMIVGTATQNLGNTISTEMWGSGFMARVIMVYDDEEVAPIDRFAEVKEDEEIEAALVLGLKTLGALRGPMEWTPEAKALLNTFSQPRNQANGAPLHNRLAHYVKRRWLHLAKLCMVAALSEGRMVVDDTDFSLAMQWLLDAEANMTEIFKDLQSHEDGQLHEELRAFAFAHYNVSRKAVPASLLVSWLSKRTSTHNVKRVLEIAVAADFLRQVAGTHGDDALYIPCGPKGTYIDLGVL